MKRSTARGALELGALGVVFGDIGTSPLYTVQTVFSPSDPHHVHVSSQSVYGVISLIFWAVIAIVTVTYVLLVMRADNDGEGGIMALITLIRRRGAPGGRRTAIFLALLGVFGASLFFGDSMITPAISVLSAISGVEVVTPSVADLVVPITAVVIIGLFALQRFGSSVVGRLFGPVMALWFTVIGALGIRGVVSNPSILKALSPTYAATFLFGHFGTAFFSLAAVVLAVTGTITCTTLLFFYIVHEQWKKPLWLVLPSAAVLLTIDLLFFAANLTKLPHGAWLPLVVGIAVFTVLTTWQKGRMLVSKQRALDEGSLHECIEGLHNCVPPLYRAPGTGIFLNRGKTTAPLALRANVEHNHVLHDHVVILEIKTLPVPHVAEADRLEIDDLGYKDDRIFHVSARFGYMDTQSVPPLLELIRRTPTEAPLCDDDISYFLSTIEIRRGKAPGMSQWRKYIFIATARLTADAAEYFQLPRDSTVIMGSRIEL